jgi:hypothetical protein
MKKAVIITSLFVSLAAFAVARQQLKPEQIYRHPRLEVVVPDFPAEGLILDIGGGGEGIIEQLKGKQVVATDLSLRRSARMTHLCSRKVDHPGRCGCGGTDGESVALSPQRGVAWSPQSGLLLSLPSGGRGYADLGHHWGNSIGARQCSRSLD